MASLHDNVKTLMAPMSAFGPLYLAQYAPQTYWDAVPLTDLKRWIGAQIPAELAPELSRGIDLAQSAVNEKAALAPAMDAYAAASGARPNGHRQPTLLRR